MQGELKDMISLILQKKIMEKYRDAKNIAGVWTAATRSKTRYGEYIYIYIYILL